MLSAYKTTSQKKIWQTGEERKSMENSADSKFKAVRRRLIRER